jgi:hypothetical protein
MVFRQGERHVDCGRALTRDARRAALDAASISTTGSEAAPCFNVAQHVTPARRLSHPPQSSDDN